MTRGPKLLVAAALAIASMVVWIALTHSGDVEAAVVRWTARSSLVLFALAYVARPARQLWRNAFTKQLLADRKWLGLAFALSHLAHLGGIIALAAPDFGAFIRARAPTTLFAAFTFVLIFAMAVTSIDRVRKAIPAATWKSLHRTGLHASWISFVTAYAGAIATSWAYAVPTGLLLAIAGVRMVAFVRHRRASS